MHAKRICKISYFQRCLKIRLVKRYIPVPRNHANKNRTAKTNENMQILAIKSIENISKNAIHIASARTNLHCVLRRTICFGFLWLVVFPPLRAWY